MRTPTVPGLADGSGLTSALRLKLRTRPHDKMDGPYSPPLFAYLVFLIRFQSRCQPAQFGTSSNPVNPGELGSAGIPITALHS